MIYTEDRHLNYSIKRIMLSNFKTFKGEHWFDIEDITLITGANNSGKSSLINGLKLFSDAFTRSDLPYLDKSAVDGLGGWNDIINHEAESVIIQKKEHKILGFGLAFNDIFSNNEQAEVVLKYEFVFDENVQTFIFSKLQIYFDNDQLLLTLVRSGRSQTELSTSIYSCDPGEILFGFDLEILNRLAGVKSPHQKLIDFLKYNFGKQWEGELFCEEDYFSNNWITSISFNDIIKEMYMDEYVNLVKAENKDDYITGVISDSFFNEYNKNKQELGYSAFLNDLGALFHHIHKHLRLLSAENLEFVSAAEIYHNRVIINSDKTRFFESILNIQKVCGITKPWVFDKLLLKSKSDQKSTRNTPKNPNIHPINLSLLSVEHRYICFIQQALYIFDINGFLIVEKIEEQCYVVKLINRQRETNMADLGKGNAKLFIAILKAASVLFDDTKKTPDIGIESDYNYDKILFFEEPEAFLHPNWQSRFADFIALCIEQRRLKILIETHSEYLVRKLQFLVAKQDVSKDRVLIYYLNNPQVVKGGEPSKRVIKIKETGQLTAEFGPGFYDESVHLMMGLLDDELLN